MLRVTGATITFMHETIRIMNICHWYNSSDYKLTDKVLESVVAKGSG